MEMNLLLTAVQWIATVSLAFVAIGYAEKFTVFLCEKFFFSDDYIDREYGTCRAELPDTDTLNGLRPHKVDDAKDTFCIIERVKRERETLLEEINGTIVSKKEEFARACVIRSMSSVSLYVVVLCTALLFLGGIEGAHPTFSHYTAFGLSLLSIIYIISGWFLGEYNKKCWLLRFSSFRHSMSCVAFFALVALSLGLICSLKTVHIVWIDKTWWYVLIACLLLSCFNFAIFSFKIWRRAQKLKASISYDSKSLKKKCTEVKKKVESLELFDELL